MGHRDHQIAHAVRAAKRASQQVYDKLLFGLWRKKRRALGALALQQVQESRLSRATPHQRRQPGFLQHHPARH